MPEGHEPLRVLTAAGERLGDGDPAAIGVGRQVADVVQQLQALLGRVAAHAAELLADVGADLSALVVRNRRGGDEQRAGGLVGDKIQDGIKNAVARRTLKDIVTSDRQEVTGEFMAEAGKSMDGMGIDLVDVRLQRIDLQEEVAASVYESMKRTFEGIARMERGEGEKEKNIVMAEADRKRTELVARALADAQRIRGEGEATAAAIYAQAYNRNPEFYSFYRSLQAYRNSLGREGDVLVISPDSDFFRYLQNPSPRR